MPPRQHSKPKRLVAAVVMPALMALAGSACGSADAGSPTDPTVVDVRLDGTYRVLSAGFDGVEQRPPSPVFVELDATFGAIEVATGCGRMLGAFSLFDDGAAGVTISGGTTSDCSAPEAAFTDEVRTLLAEVARWSEPPEGGLDLSDADGTGRLRLQRSEG